MMERTRTKSENMIKIDGEKLYGALKERGLTASQLCKELRINNGYFANAKHRGTMPNMMVVLLESRYGIPRDNYIIKEEPAVVEIVTDNDFFSEENQTKLYKLVYAAMYNAMKRALNE